MSKIRTLAIFFIVIIGVMFFMNVKVSQKAQEIEMEQQEVSEDGFKYNDYHMTIDQITEMKKNK